ncbi:MAG: DNA-directed RNA polymerase subunit beta [Fibrobacterales bacterium]
MAERRSYASKKFQLDLPNLIQTQLDSYLNFLQEEVTSNKREKMGLQQIFSDIFPITDIKEMYSLEFESYSFGVPKYSIRECRERGLSYSLPLKATLSLYVYEGEREDKKFKEKITNDVFICELPMMTHTGSFIVNGAERVVVSQLHRSPGVSFDEEYHASGKRMFKSRIIPYRGSWVEFLIDASDILYVNIDRRRKLPATILLRALGYGTNEKILELFYESEDIMLNDTTAEGLEGRVLSKEIIDEETGELIAEANTPLTQVILSKTIDAGIVEISIVKDSLEDFPVIHNTIAADPTDNQEDALFRIYSLVRPGDPPNAATAQLLFDKLFFDDKRYDLGKVGRYRLNSRLKHEVDLEVLTMTPQDFMSIIQYMVDLHSGEGSLDDIDHLGNRRVRSVGELLGNQFALGLTRMARAIRERLSLRDQEDLTPQDLINARTISSVVSTFFGSSQLSQFMDQTNPLAELTHKRRMSALGPGGLTRERAGFEVRDVHHTHYGRLCPIETPEGPNIGLINSLAMYAVVNRFGFLETPYRIVKDGKVTEEIIYLTADKEDNYIIAPASTELNDDQEFIMDYPIVRSSGEFPIVPKAQIQLMDVSTKQIVSVAAGLIPFLEHDDANRALMGSNMQRQAVPLLRSEAPHVGTGLEGRAATDSGTIIIANNSGVVVELDSAHIVIKRDDTDSIEDKFLDIPEYDRYILRKFERSNQDSCLNQRPLVKNGETVIKGQVIADGSSTQNGELALGKNILIAFLPWYGYNFEDAIIISEELRKNDTFTSIHIEQFELEVRDTKRGPEELTREIPNVSEEAVRNLDEAGVIRIGAEIEPGDILVGKITPKGETELSPEERLLRAIFGEKAGDVKDSSMKAPPGLKGVVVETRVFSRKERDKKTKIEDKEKIERIKDDIGNRIQEVIRARDHKLVELLVGQESGEVRDGTTNEILVGKGKKYTDKTVMKINFSDISNDSVFSTEDGINDESVRVVTQSNAMIQKLEDTLDKEIDKVVRGDELKPGVLQLVKVYVAKKRKLNVGDKMAGRHGNKGVISKIVPVEDMPFTEDGRPVQILLNPLGVPSRMNVGQVLEVHLGWAAQALGINVATPVFDGASYDHITDCLVEAGLPKSGKSKLIDGKTGVAFDTPVTVGVMYMLKLNHLVDDKMHARSIGPYSLVTQQPLGGKSQFGGQRFGEMEVWAMEAYGAAYTLQELLTVKSDDVMGRSKIYESIVKGENTPEPGIPESFNVLIKEIQALCLDVTIGDE